MNNDNVNQKVFHIAQNEKQFGPFSLAELSHRKLTRDMLIWREDSEEWTDWRPIEEVDELRDYIVASSAGSQLRPPRKSGGRKKVGFVGGGSPPPITPGPPPTHSSIPLTMGWFCIVFGALGLCCAPINTVGLVMESDQYDLVEFDNEETDSLEEDGAPEEARAQGLPTIIYVAGLVVFGGLLHSILLFASGIGLTMRKMWGRNWAVGCGWAGLFSIFMTLTFSFAYDIIPLAQEGTQEAIGQAFLIGIIEGVLILVFGGFYIAVITLLSSKNALANLD